MVKIRQALLSVSDKTGIVELAKALQELGVEIISTGGTQTILREHSIKVRSVSELTNYPEILDGRVKTLHPAIHGALLARPDNPVHREQMEKFGIEPIDLVVVNLYPFEETVRRNNVTLEEAVEQIDIGGPAMLRAAAKNFKYKAVVTDPSRYHDIILELKASGGSLSTETCLKLAREVFQRTSQYDTAIAEFFQYSNGKEDLELPVQLQIQLAKSETLRYGENPHQNAALYGSFGKYFEKLHGKDLSFNNILDIEAVSRITAEFQPPTAVIVKHTNPCGVGSGAPLIEAYRKAFATDTTSAFGGVIALNRAIDLETARAISEIFTEIIVAPDFPSDVLDFLKKKKDRRLIRWNRESRPSVEYDVKKVPGGFLLQQPDEIPLERGTLKVVTKRAPTDEEMEALVFAWKVAKHVKSNAIVYAKKDHTIGIGAGQMSRVDSSKLAAWKAKEAGLDLRDTVVASDGFFPFADGLLEAVTVGATAVIQPGGSIRDEEVIKAADENNIAMVFTGIRHFRH